MFTFTVLLRESIIKSNFNMKEINTQKSVQTPAYGIICVHTPVYIYDLF